MILLWRLDLGWKGQVLVSSRGALWLDGKWRRWRAAADQRRWSHLMNFLGSMGGVGGARGLLELSSRWWRGELGMGSRRLGGAGGGGGGCRGCPLPVPATPTPVPAASRALRLGELLNLLAAAFSFFFFCYTETKKQKERRDIGVKKGSNRDFLKQK